MLWQFLQRVAIPLSLVLVLTGGSWAPAQGQKDPDPKPKDFQIHAVELHAIEFETPARVGFGGDAVTYDAAVEIRLTIDAYDEGNAEPVLWVGDEELRGHRTSRQGDTYVLAFDAFEPQSLPEGGCLQLGYSRSEEGDCTFRYSSAAVTPGTALVDDRLATRGDPNPYQWDHTVQGPQCTSGVEVIGKPYYDNVQYALYDSQDRPIHEVQPGDTIAIELWNLPVRRQVQIHVVDERGQEWSYARLSANAEGHIPRTVFWFNTGVIGTTSRELRYRPDPAFVTFEEASKHWAGNRAYIELRTDDGELIQRHPLPIAPQRTQPLLYPSNAQGVLMNSMEVGKDRFYVTGMDYPAGSTVLLFVVDNRFSWQQGVHFQDLTGRGLESDVTIVQLAPGQTSFTVEAWGQGLPRRGRYDLISRVVSSAPNPATLNSQVQTFQSSDIASFGTDTAVALFEIINGHIVMEIAGRTLEGVHWSQASWFEFADVFERGEDVYGAVDPTDFPPTHMGGEYAMYYVVEKQPAAYWDTATPPVLTDISGPGGTSQPEVALVKYSCINLTRTPIWPNAQPTGTNCGENEYQVIVEFGATPATSSGTYATDGVYNKGTDFIDRYPEEGFTVVDEPSSCCLHSVGRQDHYDDVTTGSDPNRAFDMTSLGFPLVRNWFTIRYPAQSPGGVGGTLPSGSDRYPVFLILHGRHRTCAATFSGFFDPACAPADMVASHRGYDYILDALAKQGFIAISVDAYDIQPSNGLNNYEARGVLILEHLNRMEDWDLNGTDPWGGMFQNRIDMTKIAIAGHSRGGEGVVAAAEINVNMPGTYGHDIGPVIAIAPTDQQAGFDWEVLHTPYLGLIGAADGDVSNFQGFRPYDRAYPTGASNQSEKSLAWIYGANHNFWNTVWTPSFGIDPFASDDGASITGPRLTEAEQRQTGLSPIAGFVRQHLLGLKPYRQIFTGKLPLAAMPNEEMHWSYQHPDRQTMDDYENNNVATNTLGGTVTYPAGVTVSEGGIGSCSFHDGSNGSGVVSWITDQDTYVSDVPTADQDVSQYSHLSFRITQVPDGGTLNPVDQDQKVLVRLVDTAGNQRWALTSEFRQIPYPYERSLSNRPCQMKTVRIPLRTFEMNNSDVDLTAIDRVEIILPDTGKVGIDDLHFTQ